MEPMVQAFNPPVPGVHDEVWANRIYTAFVLYDNEEHSREGFCHLSIKRRDRDAAHDWRHFQWIKNDVLGPEREAIELYPAESRLVDGANQYHLWVWPAGQRIPLGFEGRTVGGSAEAALVGARQRDWPRSRRPEFNSPEQLEAETAEIRKIREQWGIVPPSEERR
jgi:hypothetical protein